MISSLTFVQRLARSPAVALSPLQVCFRALVLQVGIIDAAIEHVDMRISADGAGDDGTSAILTLTAEDARFPASKSLTDSIVGAYSTTDQAMASGEPLKPTAGV